MLLRRLAVLLVSFLFFLEKVNFAIAIVDKDVTPHYAALCYDYKYIKSYKPNVVNIGDYIQSLAAMQFLPVDENLELVPRDRYSDYRGPKVNLIMNGWYFLNKQNEVIPGNIDPVFVSLHINNPSNITQNYINDLKKYQPIGCRDYYTQQVLSDFGLNTYFSGCLTTTLDILYKAPENERTKDIVFCDYRLGNYPEADEYLKTLKNYDFSKIIFTQHEKLAKSTTYRECFAEARRLLELYARAKLVVTTRLHCALPCLALHTPVLFINRYYDYRRFPGLYELLNTVGTDKDGKFKINVKKDGNGDICNPDLYKKYADNLKKTIRNKLDEIKN